MSFKELPIMPDKSKGVLLFYPYVSKKSSINLKCETRSLETPEITSVILEFGKFSFNLLIIGRVNIRSPKRSSLIINIFISNFLNFFIYNHINKL